MSSAKFKLTLIKLINGMFETPVIKEKPPAPKVPKSKPLEYPMTTLVPRVSTFFCDKCGWCDDITTQVEEKKTKSSTGKIETSYYHPSIEPISCPQCSMVSARPLVQGNHHFAIKYLLKSFQ